MIAFIVLALTLQAVPGSGAATPQPDSLPYEGDWVVEILDNIKVMPESRVTMTIRGATISGLAPCNSYRGSFAVDEPEKRVAVKGLLKTMKACDGPRMSEEEDFFTLINDVVTYDTRGDDTLILRRDGRTISARRSAPSTTP